MATIVGEALLAASMESLVKKIISGEFVDSFRRTKLDVALLQKLNITLLSLQSVIHDAEEKQITNPAVEKWLDMLRGAVFEADDLFDEINTEELRCKVEAEYEIKSSTAHVLKKLSSCFKRFNRKINSKLEKLFERLEFLRQQNLGLKEGVSNSVWNVTPTSSVLSDVSSICGRDDDLKKLKEFLLSEEGSDGGSKIGVVSIVGMGGLGKTTLANLLYNDLQVKDKFEVRGWAHVSKDLDIVNVIKTLLESVTPGIVTASDLNKLQVQLQQSLSNKVYLLVLDDIWYGRYVGWNGLNNIFNVGKMGSKILITTRDERVALPMQAFLYVHRLRLLEHEDSWSLLAKHAFVASNDQQRSDLERIGREIAKKCDGLPLAAVALGGLLRTKLSHDYWNDVLKSSIWELADNEVQPPLLLSYRYLPAPLKGCFAYCSIFPKNSILEKKMVVQLWIAEGLVSKPKDKKCWEHEAEEYFDELVSRSLIRQRFVDNEEVSFEMHDLMNDLAMKVSSPYCIRLDEKDPHERVRHLSYTRGSYDKCDKLNGIEGLRTFLPLPLHTSLWGNYFVSSKLVFDLLPTMKQLHTLSLSNYKNITELPNSIGNLIYLRYLNLNRTKIVRLPSETCKLYNLQTLLLSYCQKLVELPKDMGKLVNLRHLDIKGTQIKELPIQMSKLENLQTLSDFMVSMQYAGCQIADLGKYPHLQGSLSISELQNVTDSSYAFQANLEMKKQIDELVLQWSNATPSNSQTQSVVIEKLRPSTNLKSLTIDGYGGNNFPNWLGDSLFCNMVYLRISKCDNCLKLPPLGQLGNLKKLFIDEMKSIKSVGVEFYGTSSPSFEPFSLLEVLSFDRMPKWKEWMLIEGTSTKFPNLKRLSLTHCPKLKEIIPLGQLSNLKEVNVKGMKSMKEIGIEFYGSNESPSFQPFSSLEILRFGDMLEWEEWKLIGGTSIEFPSLKHLSLDGCPKLKGDIPDNLPSLTKLSLDGCPQLKGDIPNNLPSLTNLSRDYCPKLIGMTPKKLPSLVKLYLHEFPLPMESIDSDDNNSVIITSPSLDVFNHLMISLKFNSLREMTLSEIPSLKFFPIDGLPKTLQSLQIWKSENLEFIPYESLHNYKSLENLYISNSCNSMTLFTSCSLPVLKTLYIGGCKNLQSIFIAEEVSQHNLLFLSSITIKCCDELELVSLGGFPIPNLNDFSLCYCKKLCLLPESMKTLASLRSMYIFDLPNLQSISIDDFPINLQELWVGNVGGISWNTTWERLTSLSKMVIFNGDDIVKALMKAHVQVLPSSLVFLCISGLKDIESLDGKWLQHLSSLNTLAVDGAPKLKSLPGKLSSSLKELYISICPLLEASLQRKRGKEWRKISHIPFININYDTIIFK